MSEITVETGELPVCVNCQFKHAVGLLHHVDPSMEKEKYSKTIELISEIGQGLMMTSQEVEDFIRVYQLEHKVEDVLTVARDLRHKIMEGSEERFEVMDKAGLLEKVVEDNPDNPDGNPIAKESAMWIATWERRRADWKRFNKPISEMKDAIISHKSSLILGREFGEDPDAYIERRGLTDYYKWKDYEQWETYAREGNGDSGEEDLEETTKPCIFFKETIKPKEYFDPESFRTLCPQCPESRCSLCPPERVCATRVITGCKAGEFVEGRCQEPTEAHAIVHGRSESVDGNPGNPEIPERCEFTKESVKPKEYFDKDSFRTICPECPDGRCANCPPELTCATRIIIGCKEGEFVKGRCRIGTEAHTIYHGTPDRHHVLHHSNPNLEEIRIVHRLEDNPGNPDGNPGTREIERELAERGIIF